MNAATPHYLLFSGSSDGTEPGRWRFVLRTPDGSKQIVAEDVEPDVRGERLELLATVRGLEALDQPSRVTLVTPSRYVRGGIRFGLNEWRRNGWRWEYFGQMVPVKNSDLWQRVDRAMRFHEIECRSYRTDPPHEPVPAAPKDADPEQRAAGHAAPEHSSTPCRLKLCVARSGTPSGRRSDFQSNLQEQSTRGARRGKHAESVAESWHGTPGLGNLSSLARLIRKKRPVDFQPAAVCREA